MINIKDVQPLKKKAEAILGGLDAALQKIEAMPVTAEEKRRLIKEWLRSRLAEMLVEGTTPENNK